MNREQFSALHYTAPGTDIIIGLPKTIFGKALEAIMLVEKNSWQICRRKKCSQHLTVIEMGTKPLSYAGTITFKDGKVVDFSAEQGEDVLAKLLDTDEGARRLEKSHLYLTLHLFLNLASSFSIHYLMKTHRIT